LKIILFIALNLILILYVILPSGYFEAEGRCPNGYHKDESGECEKVTDNTGKPRCPNGYHRSPDGDCERVDDSGSSSSKSNDDNNDDDNNQKKASTKSTSDDVKESSNCQGDADCFEGRVTEVVDGDTIDINSVRIRLSLINTPEIGESGYTEAKEFVESTCGVGSWARMDEDDGQKGGSFGRMIGAVYCKNSDTSLNEKVLQAGHAEILQEFCDVSEFSTELWAMSSCQMGRNENNIVTDNSNQESNSLSAKQEQQTEFESKSAKSNEAQSYSNSKLGISLEHPDDWKIGNLKNGIQLIKEKNGIYVEIRKHNLESQDVQLKQYAADDIKDRSSSREDFKLLNITKTTIAGNLPAYKALYTFLKTDNQKDFTTEGTTNKILRIWTFAEDNAYHIAFVADNNNYGLYLPIAEKIFDTLKINPGTQQSFSEDDSKGNNNDNDSKDNTNDNDSKSGDDGGDKDCSDFDKKNFKVQPGDPYDLDRDGNGIACEG
jgi:micrococcal nuclease